MVNTFEEVTGNEDQQVSDVEALRKTVKIQQKQIASQKEELAALKEQVATLQETLEKGLQEIHGLNQLLNNFRLAQKQKEQEQPGNQKQPEPQEPKKQGDTNMKKGRGQKNPMLKRLRKVATQFKSPPKQALNNTKKQRKRSTKAMGSSKL
jgi:chromosome segregation ATPase